MATRQFMKHCPTCGRSTLHLGPSPAHLLHLILSIITLGAWIIVWIIVTANANTQGQCTVCGTEYGVFGSTRQT